MFLGRPWVPVSFLWPGLGPAWAAFAQHLQLSHATSPCLLPQYRSRAWGLAPCQAVWSSTSLRGLGPVILLPGMKPGEGGITG